MDRRRALAVATATVATTIGAGAALAANLGLLGFGGAGDSPLGKLDAGQVISSVELPPGSTPGSGSDVTVRYEDIYLPVPSTEPAPVVPAPDLSVGAAGEHEDGGHEDDGHEDDGHEDDGHEEDDD
jgi:hypothetical protein